MRCFIAIDPGLGSAVALAGSEYTGIADARRAAIAEGRDFVLRRLSQGRPIIPDMFAAVTGEAGELVSMLSLRTLLFGDVILDRHRTLYGALPCPCLRLNGALTVVNANASYLRATLTDADTIVGRNLFEVFPDNPNDPDADGAASLSASLTLVLRTRSLHRMARQRYDIRTRSGSWLLRYWLPVNVPVLDHNGEVAEIIHHVERA